MIQKNIEGVSCGAIRFISEEHYSFFMDCMTRVSVRDSYHMALLYTLGLTEETRAHVDELFNFHYSFICIPENQYWQTGTTRMVCRLAFNLWNGYIWDNDAYSVCPYEIFDCELAPYFLEAIKVKFHWYCQ